MLVGYSKAMKIKIAANKINKKEKSAGERSAIVFVFPNS